MRDLEAERMRAEDRAIYLLCSLLSLLLFAATAVIEASTWMQCYLAGMALVCLRGWATR